MNTNLNAVKRAWILIWVLLATPTLQAKLNVIATLPDLAAVAEAIGGEEIDIASLARPMEDPHFVDPKPSLIIKLNRADALLEGGAGLEQGWLGPLVQSARNRAILPGGPGRLDCHAGVTMLEVPEALDRSEGDIHAEGNPHYLMDPRNAKIVATNMAELFCRLDGQSCAVFRANLERFARQIDEGLARWSKALRPFAGQRVVAYHDSWPYFAERFGLRIDLFLEPKPGIPPSPAHLAEVVRQVREDRIRVVMVEPFLSRRTAETVARNSEATVVEVTQFPGGIRGTGKDYVAMMDHLVGSLAEGLSQKKQE